MGLGFRVEGSFSWGFRVRALFWGLGFSFFF